MDGTNLTIEETVAKITHALRDYIEATYHVGDPAIVEQRRDVLDEEGVIFRAPFIESTPRYVAGPAFSDIRLTDAARTLFSALVDGRGDGRPKVFDPPYKHQAAALEAVALRGESLVVSTGTGSGKTETFLLPLLAKLADEALERPQSFAQPAVRALLLYPMNALVNDQLARLRLLVGDPIVATQFSSWAGRPARFARYTSRTLYPGVRTAKKDSERLRSIERFYIHLLEQADDAESGRGQRARLLIDNLQARGKWPAKPDLRAWFGEHGGRWRNSAGEWVRAVLCDDDPELLTRHEVLDQPPDILITNYSMLEYMLMRPLERPIFDATSRWLQENPSERLLLVVDEAHMYSGAGGAEVALLLRRLRTRLQIPKDRLQVICTSASFSDVEYARQFAAQLTGKTAADFNAIRGELALRVGSATGDRLAAEQLAAVPLARFYDADTDHDRLDAVKPFLDFRSVDDDESCAASLHAALADFPPMGELVNLTMTRAMPVAELAGAIFPDVEAETATPAVTALIALGSFARPTPEAAGLLPCRVHGFFRGLPGLWACADPDCTLRRDSAPSSPIGRLFAQPRTVCDCGARVFELYTCRNCGAAYLRAYTDSVDDPSYLWNEPGAEFAAAAGRVGELQALDLLVEAPTRDAEPADLDLTTGRLNPPTLGPRTRSVYLRHDRTQPSTDDDDDDDPGSTTPASLGEFRPCGVCGTSASFGRTSVQDHQTKGDQPFQALITRQIEVQPPGAQPASDFAPLRGRKVLTFSDSRQTAARLAPNLQDYAMRDVLRPVMLRGWRALTEDQLAASAISLDHLYIAVLVGAHLLSVRLRPELQGAESPLPTQEVRSAFDSAGGLNVTSLVFTLGASQPPFSLLRAMHATVADRYYGLTSLGLAALRERPDLSARILALPGLTGVADTDERKLFLARVWLEHFARKGIWFQAMDSRSFKTPQGVRPHSGKFTNVSRWIADGAARKSFEKEWLPSLLSTFCEQTDPRQYRLRAGTVTLSMDIDWGYCQTCRTTQPWSGSARCWNCQRDAVVHIDPDVDPVFVARKGYYRGSSVRALSAVPEPPMAIIAAEHTAQLNAAGTDDVFSTAEAHELLFQDVDIGADGADNSRDVAIDVLSCTTTMEVGIDIGALSGVALRNMPPSRASYQQRAGRAGRRGNAVATVLAFGSADTHDEQYFASPDAMIRGQVDDPILTLDNADIAQRHVTAYLFQQYLQARLPEIDAEDQPQLFEVLGPVEGFLDPEAPLNRDDFGSWLSANESVLRRELDGWLPDELSTSERRELLADFAHRTLRAVDEALDGGSDEQPLHGDRLRATDPIPTTETDERSSDELIDSETAPELDEERDATPELATVNLLQRLLYKGVLPRYAFPTDVVSFFVFDRSNSTRFRAEFAYSPSQGLPIALSQYAPGKEIWIDGKLWTSRALYSPAPAERRDAWEHRQLYFECAICHYAKTVRADASIRGAIDDCPACGSPGQFGPAHNWLRPPGFAHPVSLDEGTSADDQPARSYATRAKLVASGPSKDDNWMVLTPRLRTHYHRRPLLVTNSGPRREGYTYCVACGLIEPTASASGAIANPHPKPYPDDREPQCPGGFASRGLVLGTDFISDVLLMSLRVEAPLTLRPGNLATEVALRTLCEAITLAATRRLGIEAGEVQAEFRPALTVDGHAGLEAELYLYDTLAGGAGFARRIGDQGVSVFEDAIALLEECPAGCDHSCYRCLRSFRNRFEHSLLDRHLGATLLRYVVRGQAPMMVDRRANAALDRLFDDLTRQGIADVTFDRNALVDVPGIGSVVAPIRVSARGREMIVGVHGPLTPDLAETDAVHRAKEYGAVQVELVDAIILDLNLPAGTRQVLAAIAPE